MSRSGIIRSSVALGVAILTAGCDSASPSPVVAGTYALARIGAETLPIGQGPSGGAPFLLGDTLELESLRPRDDESAFLLRIEVLRDADGTTHRLESEHSYQVQDNVLTYDSCPRDALCIASLVYAPLAFSIVGDSLFQIIPAESPLPFPARVYGRTSRR